jgi:DNA-binding MarR family transcriptional regulator
LHSQHLIFIVPAFTFTDRSLLFLSIRLGRLITNRIHQRMAPHDQHLIGPNMGILADLWHKDGVRQQDLAVSSIKDKATITRGLQALEKEGLVLRAPDPVDKRTKRIYITPQGRKVVQRVAPIAQEVMAGAQEGIPPEDLATYERVLQQLYDNLNN